MENQSASSVDPATSLTASTQGADAPRRRLHSLTPATDAGNSLNVDPDATIEESEVGMVDYAGSFRLRYASASTVRKEKKLWPKRRADNESEEEDGGEQHGDVVGDDGVTEREIQRQEGLETQEASVKLRGKTRAMLVIPLYKQARLICC